MAGDLAEIGGLFGRADRRLARLDRDVGRADAGEVALVGDDEDDALVAVLQDEGVIALVQARHDDVAALDQAHALGGLDVGLLVEEALHPGPGGVDKAACLHLYAGAVGTCKLDVPQPAIVAAPRRDAAMAGEDAGAHLARRLDIGDHQARIVDPGVGIDEALLERGLQADAELRLRQVDGDRLGQGHVPVEMVVEEEAEPQHPPGPEVRLVRQHEAQRPAEMRRLGQQHLALLQRLAHQAELVVFEVAQPAMDQLGGGRGGRAGQIGHLAQPDRERRGPPRRRRCPRR